MWYFIVKSGEVVVVGEQNSTVVSAGCEEGNVSCSVSIRVLCTVYRIATGAECIDDRCRDVLVGDKLEHSYLSAQSGAGDSSLIRSRSSRFCSRSAFISSMFL